MEFKLVKERVKQGDAELGYRSRWVLRFVSVVILQDMM